MILDCQSYFIVFCLFEDLILKLEETRRGSWLWLSRGDGGRGWWLLFGVGGVVTL
ncbi:hypothetical protein HanIR_Chr05g0233591 [Helianthus annuus]|nr:hypothetical protein HanIR_Chr05g0233591 [Helianthus annuus]